MRGIVGYFKSSTVGIKELGAMQAQCENPVTKPIQDVTTRWRSAFNMANWFRIQRESIISFNIKHARDATDAYKENQLNDMIHWDVIEQSVAVLTGLAEANQVSSAMAAGTAQ